jgi:outer membrane protein OmpA-like peptidoglycan-associated protein
MKTRSLITSAGVMLLAAGCVTDTGPRINARPLAPPAMGDYRGGPFIIANNLLFDSGSAELSESARAEAARAAKWLIASPGDRVILQGHTDDLGDPEFNLQLGLQRAEAVKWHMVRLGVDRDRITTVSFGPNMPLVRNTSAANRELNRRVVFMFIPGEAAND